MAEIIRHPALFDGDGITPEAAREFAALMRSRPRSMVSACLSGAKEQALEGTAEQVWMTLAVFDIMQAALRLANEDKGAAVQFLSASANALDVAPLKNLLRSRKASPPGGGRW